MYKELLAHAEHIGLKGLTYELLIALPMVGHEDVTERVWCLRPKQSLVPLGYPEYRSNLNGWRDPLDQSFEGQGTNVPLFSSTIGASFTSKADEAPVKARWWWHHLIYAYMIENTGIYEIFRKVLHEYRHGEKLGVPSPNGQRWLRVTEELFYRDPHMPVIFSLASDIRPDLRAARRNAYQRMFGMDLNHGTADNKPYPYVRAEAANTEFVATFEELLREVWVGIVNLNNTSGANPTDDGKILTLARKLHDMLISRRVNGNLSREEFVFVSTMAWFHLSMEVDPPLTILGDLQAKGEGPEQRLFQVAQRVGVPAHGLSRSYFDLAEPISLILLGIEQLRWENQAAAQIFYNYKPVRDLMNKIITHWSTITGRDVKAGKVATT